MHYSFVNNGLRVCYSVLFGVLFKVLFAYVQLSYQIITVICYDVQKTLNAWVCVLAFTAEVIRVQERHANCLLEVFTSNDCYVQMRPCRNR